MVQSNIIQLATLVETVLEISGRVEWSDLFGNYIYIIQGMLTRRDTGLGIPNKEIFFIIDGLEYTQTAITKTDVPGPIGYFEWVFGVGEIGDGLHSFQCEFKGDTEFAGCE